MHRNLELQTKQYKTWQWTNIKATESSKSTDHYYYPRPTMIPSIACSCPVLYPWPMFTSAHVHSHISTEDDPCECDQTHLAAHNPTIRRYHARYVRPSSYNTPLTQTLNSKSLLHPPPYPISWHSTLYPSWQCYILTKYFCFTKLLCCKYTVHRWLRAFSFCVFGH